MKQRLPEVVIGEPIELGKAKAPTRAAATNSLTREEYTRHIREQLEAALQGGSDECPVARDLRAHPDLCLPPGQSAEFLAGFFGGLLYAVGTGNQFPISAIVNHILTHVMEAVAHEWERVAESEQRTEKKAA